MTACRPRSGFSPKPLKRPPGFKLQREVNENVLSPVDIDDQVAAS